MTNKQDHEQSSMGDALKNFIKHNKLEKGLTKIEVAAAWSDLMDNGVNNYTKKVHLENGILHVSLTSSVLREELGYGKQRIMDRLNNHLGKEIIKKIVLH